MKLIARKFLLSSIMVCTGLMTACTSPGYNSNPSQQITNDRVGCLASTDFFSVYFSVHLQPSVESRDAGIGNEIFRSYCNDLPAPGKVFLTADLVGTELRRTAIGVRIVEGDPGEEESSGENFRIQRTISEVPAKIYANGVIEATFDVDRSGYYVVSLNRGEEYPDSEGDNLEIPLHVGIESGANRFVTRILLLGAASGLALIGFFAFRSLRRNHDV